MPAPIPQTRGRIKSPEEMKRIQEEDAVLQQQARASFTPEKNEAKALASIEVGRYVKGPFRGLFVVWQIVSEGPDGKPLKKPVRKAIADGVDIVVTMAAIETAVRKRAFR